MAILDAAGNEIVRHGASSFLGELNLLSGQTVFVTALVTKPLRYIAVERDALREVLFDDGPLSDLVLSTFIARREALQTVQGLGLEIVGPRSSESTMQMLDFVRANRLPFSWQDTQPEGGAEPPLVRLPGGVELQHPSRGEVLRALGVGRELAPREEVDLLVVGAGPAGLAAAVYGASEGLDTLIVESTALGRPGGIVAPDRELPRLPGRHQRHRAHQPCRQPGAQVRRTTRHALPRRRARARQRTARRPPRRGARDRRTGRRAGDRGRLPATPSGRAGRVRGRERVLRGRAAGGAAVRRLAGRDRGRRQLRRAGRGLARAGRRARDLAPSPGRSGARRCPTTSSTSSTASASLFATAARSPRSTERTGNSRPSRSRAASTCRSRPSSSSSAHEPCTEWLDDAVARDC